MTTVRRGLLILALAALGAPAPVLAQADTNSAAGAAAQSAPTDAAACGAPVAADHVRCFARVKLQSPGGPRVHSATAVGTGGYTPGDLQAAYGMNSANGGHGQTIGVVDVADDPYAESDLAAYRNAYGLAACTTANGCFRKVRMTGALPDANWAMEISLDLDMVSASCPNCRILLVEVPQDTSGSASVQAIMQGVTLAIQLGATQVSLSLGASEFSSEALSDSQLNHPGIAIAVASGDNGYGTSYPATSPYAIAVGGTRLQRSATARGWTETVWTGTGSGCSAYESKPAWQHDPSCAKRMTNDVAVVGDPVTGVAVYDSYPSGGWTVLGGTSVGAPLVAGIIALSNGIGGTGAQALYGAPVNDVTVGSNGICTPLYFCTAASGYDGPTGVGTPTGITVPPPPAPTGGYWLVAADGGIFPFGNAGGYGSTGAMRLNQPIVGMARSPSGAGYWLVAADGGIFPFGDAAPGLGSTGNMRLNQPIVGMAPSPSGHGYWLVAADGGIFPFGDAALGLGSTGNVHLNAPIVGMASTPSGHGYWLVAADGGIFTFGDAVGYGSTGNMRLNKPVVGMAATPTGHGYWLVASDGGIFPFGDAAQGLGSTGGMHLNAPIVGMAATPSAHGYWLVASDGGMFPFGDAGGWGSTGNLRLNQPMVGMAATP